MSAITLEAIERKPGKFNEEGFVAGNVYGDGIDKATSVKFEEKALNKLLKENGKNAKLWVNINDTKKFGYVKEVQRKHLKYNVSHVDVQLVSSDRELKIVVPVTFKGEDTLKINLLQLLIHKLDITVLGKLALIPEMLEIDVSNMKLDDEITTDNIGLDKGIKVEDEETLIATIVPLRVILVEEPVVEEKEEVVVEESKEK
ncbi:MAG: 50S ribosomal protein L25 [Mobilitalea sp.]